MKEKGRKLLALFTMLAVIVTYSFSASIVSVYAEDEQGEVSAKAVAAESAAPAEQKEAKAKEPAPEQAAPAAPAEEPAAESADGEDVVAADSEEVEADVIAAEEEAAPAKEEVAEETKDDVPVNIDTDHGTYGPITYNQVMTLRPTYNNQGSSVIHTWSLSGADGCYTWDESAHQLKNANKSDEMQTVVVIHTQFIKGLMGSTKTEKWTIQLRRASRVVVDYYDWRGSICHTETVINGESTTVWGIPEREGFLFLGWSRTNPAPEVTPADPTFNPGNTIIPSQYATGYQNGVGHLRLYSIWHRSDLNLGTVTGKSDTVPYTGNEQTLYGIVEGSVEGNYTKFYSVKHGNGARVWYTNYYILTNDVYAKGTEPGPYDTAVEFARVYVWNTNDIGGSIAASNMYVKVKKGTLTIEDVPVLTAEAISGTWTYDGTAHPGGPASITLNGEDVTETWAEKGLTVKYQYQIPGGAWSRIVDEWPAGWSQTEVGVREYKMIVSYPGIDNIVVFGTLEVTPATMEFKVTDYSDVYDGKAHGVEVDTSTLPEGYTLLYSLEGTPTSKWVSKPYTWTNVELDDKGNPVSHEVYVMAQCDNYESVIESATVTILPRSVTVNVELSNDSRPYNGELQTYIASFTFTTEDEVLSEMKEFAPAYKAGKHDYWAKGQEVGKYETVVKSEAENYNLLTDPSLEVNFDPTYVVTQGWLEIYSEPATLTFKLDGGTLNGSTEDYKMEVNTGDEITIPDAPTRDGYEFVEWRGSSYQPGDTYKVLGSHTFKAIWKSTSTGGDSDANDGDGVDTGDSMNLGMTLALMTLAVIAILGLIFWRRREA